MDTLITIYGDHEGPASIETSPAFENLSRTLRVAAFHAMAEHLLDLATMESGVSLEDCAYEDLLEVGEAAPPRPRGGHLRLVHSV